MRGLGPYLGRDGLITQILLIACGLLPWAACLDALLPDRSGTDWPLLVVLVVGLPIVSRIRNREYHSLGPDRQRRLREVLITGNSTHDAELDDIARRRLTRAADMYPVAQAALAAIALAILAVPVIAAVTLNPLWILADVAASAAMFKLLPALARNPRRRLQRLTRTSSG